MPVLRVCRERFSSAAQPPIRSAAPPRRSVIATPKNYKHHNLEAPASAAENAGRLTGSRLIVVPYELGRLRDGVGNEPEHLWAAGAEDVLSACGVRA